MIEESSPMAYLCNDVVFVGQDDCTPAKYIVVPNATNINEFVDEILKTTAFPHNCKLRFPSYQFISTKPAGLISVIGEMNFSMQSEILEKVFTKGILKAAQTTGAWIVDTGLDCGVVKHLGVAMQEANIKDIPCIGIAFREQVMLHESLYESAMTHQQVFYDASTPNPPKSNLEPHHTHFILVDGVPLDNEILFVHRFEDYVSEKYQVPLVVIALNGGPQTVKAVALATAKKIPVIVIQGSGQAADAIASLVRKAQDEGIVRTCESLIAIENDVDISPWCKLLQTINNDSETVAHVTDAMNKVIHYHQYITLFDVNEESANLEDRILRVFLANAKPVEIAEKLQLGILWNSEEIVSELMNYDVLPGHVIMTQSVLLDRPKIFNLVANRPNLQSLKLKQLYLYKPTMKFFERLPGYRDQVVYSGSHSGSSASLAASAPYETQFAEDSAKLRASLGGVIRRVGHAFIAYHTTFNTKLDGLHTKAKLKAETAYVTFTDLLIWAIFVNRVELAKAIWKQTSLPEHNALLACQLYRYLSLNSPTEKEAYAAGALWFENEVVKLMDNLEKEVWMLEWNEMGKKSALDIAQDADCKRVLSNGVIQNLLDDGNAVEWKALKLVVLGHGEIGKTSLLRKMDAQKNVLSRARTLFVKQDLTTTRTIGIDQYGATMAGGDVSIWDFGGQLEYSVTHGFFLSTEMVIYVVCFDLAASFDQQVNQVSFWLDFLQSSLFPKSHDTWSVMVAGLRADLQPPRSTSLTQANVSGWRSKWHKLPLDEQLFLVSAHQDSASVRKLIKSISLQCEKIFSSSIIRIPPAYKSLLREIQIQYDKPDECVVHINEIAEKHSCGLNPARLRAALKHLHSIGQVVLLPNDHVCTIPSWIPKIAAKFVCPSEVQAMTLTTNRVEILTQEQVGQVLAIEKHNETLNAELKLMCHFGVCFELPSLSETTTKEYLFPSLGEKSAHFKFSIEPEFKPQYAGVQFQVCDEGSIFVPGFFCKFVVAILQKLRTSKTDLVKVFSNGCVIKCPSMINGEIIVILADTSKSISVVMMAASPDLEYFTSIFSNLVKCDFKQYTGFITNHLCPTCIESCKSEIHVQIIGIFDTSKSIKDQVCSIKHHKVTAPSLPSLHVKECWTHKRSSHHFFLSYRVATEGIRAKFSEKEPEFGIVQLLYQSLSTEKRPDGSPVYIFWDKQCLNPGQDWEKGFVNGLKNASVIVLLVSPKGLQGIAKNMKEKKQDNVLLEYESALLQNITHGTPVVQVFLSEIGENIDESKRFETFDFSFLSSLPDLPHVREEDAQTLIDSMRSQLPHDKVTFLDSVSKTFAKLKRLQGFQLAHRGEDQTEVDNLVNVLMAILQKIATP